MTRLNPITAVWLLVGFLVCCRLGYLALGRVQSWRWRRSVRREMARMDAEIAHELERLATRDQQLRAVVSISDRVR
jgi:hypothetical protein